MSPRLKQFMLVSLVGLIVVLTALIHFHRQLNRSNLEEHFSSHNRVLAMVLRNALLKDGLLELLHVQAPHTTAAADLERIDGKLREYLRWVSVVKVKIYSRDGLTLYSTDRSEVGKDASGNQGVLSALAGKPLSNIVYRDRVNTLDGVIEKRDLHQQYVPLRSPISEEIEGVFEIYSDVSTLLNRISDQAKLILAVIAGILGAFYATLFLVFRRTDRALEREQAKREAYLHEVETIKSELEVRVAQRTRELDASRQFLQSVIDGIANPLLVIRPDLSVSLMNRAARQLIPPGADPKAYTHCYQISHRRAQPCEGDEHPCAFAQVVQHGRTARVRHTHYDGDGQPMIVDVVSTPLYGVNGKLEGVIEVEHDVTQLVRMQAGLVASETRLQAIMDNVPDAILTCSEDGVIETFNQSARRLFGVSNSELVGMPLSQLVVDEVRFDAGKGDNRLREVTARRLNGAEFPADMWQGEMAPGGQTQHIVVVRDITLRRLAQEELEKTRQQYFHQEKMAAIGQLAAGILHEVGNPIAAIAGAAAQLQDVQACGFRPQAECPFDDAIDRNIKLIDEQTARLATITREIADFASPRPRERELVDLNSLLQSTARLLSYDRRFRDVELILELDRGLPAIAGVADQLTQVFMNLLINAMDACAGMSERKPRITIASVQDGDRVQVVVTDNGCGMPEEVAARAMEPFFTTKAVGKGTGLGLSLCDTIAHAHGGFLFIDSKAGEGTAVHVVLPIEAPLPDHQPRGQED